MPKVIRVTNQKDEVGYFCHVPGRGFVTVNADDSAMVTKHILKFHEGQRFDVIAAARHMAEIDLSGDTPHLIELPKEF